MARKKNKRRRSNEEEEETYTIAVVNSAEPPQLDSRHLHPNPWADDEMSETALTRRLKF